MIQIRYDEAAGLMEIMGHAGAGQRGSDPVCAAASMLLHTAERALAGEADISAERGKALIRTRGSKNAHRTLGIIMKGCEWLEDNYPDNVKIQRG